jgi:hypothetical protein
MNVPPWQDDGFLLGDTAGHFKEAAAVADLLHVSGDDTGMGVFAKVLDDVCLGDIGFIAKAEKLREAHLFAVDEIDHTAADGARLGEETNAAYIGHAVEKLVLRR